ncbi:MAG: endonuclease [Balneolia bacterium]|nr:endonuclease [Balneolia bacterium]
MYMSHAPLKFTLNILLLFILLPGIIHAQNQQIGGDRTGEELLEYLRENYTPNQTLGYDTARDRMYTILDNFDGMVVCLYTYFEVPVDPNSSTPRADAFQGGNGINAEHLWPQSLGAGNEPARSDLHSLYASEIRVNADRANYKFGDIPDEDVDRWYNKVNRDEGNLIFTTTPPPVEVRDEYSKITLSGDIRFEVKKDMQGDVARAMFYFYTIYRNQADASDPNYFSSMSEALRSWHNADHVGEYELWRTSQIEEWQGNVNPFIADTTLVRRAYFTDDDSTPDPDPDPEFDIIFAETFGNPSSTTPISDHSYDNENLTFEGNGDIRSSIPSQGYPGASGGGLVFMNLGQRFLTISNIDVLGYEDIGLTFGVHTGDTESFLIEYSLDNGGSWFEIQYESAVSANQWTLFEVELTAIPSVSDVSLRFSKNSDFQFRLDDITLYGNELTGTSTEPVAELPESITLEQNYPNPFNPTTAIRFALAESGHVRLSVYDMLGRRVAVLVDEARSSGSHTVRWDAAAHSSGIYLYRIDTPAGSLTRSMTLLK